MAGPLGRACIMPPQCLSRLTELRNRRPSQWICNDDLRVASIESRLLTLNGLAADISIRNKEFIQGLSNGDGSLGRGVCRYEWDRTRRDLGHSGNVPVFRQESYSTNVITKVSLETESKALLVASQETTRRLADS